MDSLLTEVMKKSSVVWLRIGATAPILVWTVWIADEHGTGAYVIHGGAEQQVPGLAAAQTCEVIARSNDNHALAVTFPAAVTVLEPQSPAWEAAVAALLPKRLNVPDLATAADRWATTCTVSRLTPLAVTAPA